MLRKPLLHLIRLRSIYLARFYFFFTSIYFRFIWILFFSNHPHFPYEWTDDNDQIKRVHPVRFEVHSSTCMDQRVFFFGQINVYFFVSEWTDDDNQIKVWMKINPIRDLVWFEAHSPNHM